MSLTFDEASHTYRYDGTIVPSVTQIIEPMYDFRFVKPEHLEVARTLGSAVDKTIRLFEQDRLDEERTPERLKRYLAQWKKFKKENGFHDGVLGVPFLCSEYMYAGTPDIHGKIGADDHEILLDFKTGDKYAPHKLQTAGYLEALVRDGKLPKNTVRASLYLDEHGYNLDFHRDINDRAAFLSALTIYKWRQKNGI